ncbi:MAG: hypothetical protein CMC86_08415 [Flavobacteriaceae bacterium]|nr:hypothetical protein [Flavobacteriaceae bacterium]|tara:strand:+ start:357 stop:1769 length:1413 start_codon:yes stop_codon:yes gene_type:complete
MKANYNKETADKSLKNSKEALKEDAKGLFVSLKLFLIELLDFRNDTDRAATISAIKADISIKGATAWILICSIFVCSIGLNADSTAVVIGAMLISPLMGPILGIGLSIAINDIYTLKKSLINLGTMLVLSLFTAFLFFYFFPLHYESHELLGRTKPDIRDILIAFFGGSALIIARTKKGTIATVIFGVAIATALMPPLCTAGYGLSEGKWGYFGNAMLLFLINTMFIALATFLVLKLLRFPKLTYANSRRRRNIAKIAALFAFILTIPAGYTFIKVLKESQYDLDYNNFLEKEIKSNTSLWLQRESMDKDLKTINLIFNGDVNDATKSDLLNELKQYEHINTFKLTLNGNSNRSTDKILDLYDIALDKIEVLNYTIDSLNLVLEATQKSKFNINFLNVAKDVKIQFPDLQSFGYSKFLQSSDFRATDTIYVARVKWNPKMLDSLRIQKTNILKAWLIDYSGLENIEIVTD